MISASERQSLFLAELAPLEREELFIITDHAWRRYTRYLIELSELPWAQDVQMDVDMFGLPSRPYTQGFESLGIDDRVDWLMSLGTQNPHDFLTAGFDAARSVVLMGDHAKTEWSIDQVIIMGVPFHARYPTSQKQAWVSQKKMEFEGDVGNKPNLGWVVANERNRYTVNWGLRLLNHGQLQEQGHVLWDEDRIRGETLVHLKDLIKWEDE